MGLLYQGRWSYYISVDDCEIVQCLQGFQRLVSRGFEMNYTVQHLTLMLWKSIDFVATWYLHLTHALLGKPFLSGSITVH